MASNDLPLYMGFDLSTQQLKVVVVDSGLQVKHVAKFDFDADSKGYDIKKGVMVNEKLHEVYAPVALWLQAIDGVMERLKQDGMDFSRLKAISGAGQQHGSVYWSSEGEHALQNLDPSKKLEEQLDHAFSHPFSPNWQDSSTQAECDNFDEELSSEEHLAQATGSKAHHRFTGPQILRFQHRNPEAYAKTSRISLVSSFLASIFLGRIAPIDISDVCGMNLWDIQAGKWNQQLLLLASNGNATDLEHKLGQVPADGGASLGHVSKYFVDRYGFASDCKTIAFTGDNPSTILALPLRSNDAMVSLGTSTTFLMSTPIYKPDPAVHFFNHPTTPGLYMFMLCYKNGGLAREHVRDAINKERGGSSDASEADIWSDFNAVADQTSPLGQTLPDDPNMHLGLYFPRAEIVPNVRAGTWRFSYAPETKELIPFHAESSDHPKDGAAWNLPSADARAILESQLLSLRLRSKDIVEPSPEHPDLPPQPRRVYLVGGGSKNPLMANFAGNVLGGSDGVYKLDIGENACALGAAYKAVWAADRKEGETFEELIGSRWDEDKFVEKVGSGFDKGLFERYGLALEGFEKMERVVLEDERQIREQEGRGKGKRLKTKE